MACYTNMLKSRPLSGPWNLLNRMNGKSEIEKIRVLPSTQPETQF